MIGTQRGSYLHIMQFSEGDQVKVFDEYGDEINGTVTCMRAGQALVEWNEKLAGGFVRNWFPVSELQPQVMSEGTQFDKFMDKILVTEQRSVKVSEKEDSPQRKIAKLYRETAPNRTVYRRGGTK